MVSPHWTNKWVLMYIVGLILQLILYPFIALTKPEFLVSHLYFYDVMVIAIISMVVQIIGFGIIMNRTKDMDPSIYSQGRPFRHKLREEDEEVATRKPTQAE
ncbi:MAG: hypothetical protein ACFFF4_05350 [Candidatus Thorarchaeota archaeon]